MKTMSQKTKSKKSKQKYIYVSLLLQFFPLIPSNLLRPFLQIFLLKKQEFIAFFFSSFLSSHSLLLPASCFLLPPSLLLLIFLLKKQEFIAQVAVIDNVKHPLLLRRSKSEFNFNVRRRSRKMSRKMRRRAMMREG